jgi:2-polyprenyl-3-methyl-5-hydroxy-6-metoxy-1,4-benzoquinol methylase
MAQNTPRRHEDLDLFARIFKVFADTPWLHYGLWLPGETPSMPKLLEAQERYVEKLVALLPPAPASVLDIGGGTGAMAGRLHSLGYEVEMLTPSEVQVGLARESLGDRVRVHHTRLEEFSTDRQFDVCLFSESFQYMPMSVSLPKVKAMLKPGGCVVIADCFRSENYRGGRQIGGGHRFINLPPRAEEEGLRITSDEDVTAMAAGTILLDRRVYTEVIAPIVSDLGASLRARSRALHWLIGGAYRLFVRKAERERIADRLRAEHRTPERFIEMNTYRFLRLERADG